MTPRKPPSRGMCLWMAQMYWEMRPSTAQSRQLSWDFLFAWGFYEMYVEGWYE